MKILPVLLIAAGIGLFACRANADANKSEGFGELTVDQVADLISKHDVDLIDNNGKSDWQKGHVPGARWVAFNEVKESDLPKDHARKLVFYCANPH